MCKSILFHELYILGKFNCISGEADECPHNFDTIFVGIYVINNKIIEFNHLHKESVQMKGCKRYHSTVYRSHKPPLAGYN